MEEGRTEGRKEGGREGRKEGSKEEKQEGTVSVQQTTTATTATTSSVPAKEKRKTSQINSPPLLEARVHPCNCMHMLVCCRYVCILYIIYIDMLM